MLSGFGTNLASGAHAYSAKAPLQTPNTASPGLNCVTVSSDLYYLASNIHAGPLALHAPVQRIDGSGANPYDDFVVLRNRPFEVLHFEDLSRFGLGVDGGFHVG